MSKLQKYIQLIPIYGIPTLCRVIEIYEAQENYEECQIIHDALSEFSRGFGIELPEYRMNDNVKSLYISAYKQITGRDSTYLLDNVDFYAQELINKYT